MAIEVSKNHRAYLVESVKTAGQMIIDMAEDIVGNSDNISDLDISATFDQDMESIPEITITRSHIPSREELEHLFDIRQRKVRSK